MGDVVLKVPFARPRLHIFRLALFAPPFGERSYHEWGRLDGPSSESACLLFEFADLTLLVARDFADFKARRPVLGKAAYKMRVRGVLRSASAQKQAAACVKGLRSLSRGVLQRWGCLPCLTLCPHLLVSAGLLDPANASGRDHENSTAP